MEPDDSKTDAELVFLLQGLKWANEWKLWEVVTIFFVSKEEWCIKSLSNQYLNRQLLISILVFLEGDNHLVSWLSWVDCEWSPFWKHSIGEEDNASNAPARLLDWDFQLDAFLFEVAVPCNADFFFLRWLVRIWLHANLFDCQFFLFNPFNLVHQLNLFFV